MKKIILTVAIAISCVCLNAQGFYIDANLGYGFGMPGNVLGQNTHTDIINGVQTKSSKNLLGSIGQGFSAQITPGYMINENLGFELGINYFVGAKTVMGESTSSLTVDVYGIKEEPWSNRKDVAHSNQLRLSPAIVLSTGTSKTFSGYAKLGIIMPVIGSTFVETDAVSAVMVAPGVMEKTPIEVRTEVKGMPSFGFRGAIGLNYKITDNLSVFGELYALSLNIRKKNQIMKSYKSNGVEGIDAMPKYNTDIEYVDELDKNSNNEELNGTKDYNRPNEQLFEKTSFSQLGIQLGVKYTFGK